MKSSSTTEIELVPSNAESVTDESVEFVSEPLEDVHDTAIEGCAEGNPMVARNLRRLSGRLLRLAFLIEYGDRNIHAPSILESKRLLDEQGTTLPRALATQLEAALGWVPLGLIHYGEE